MQELNMPKYEALGLTELRTNRDGQTRKVISDWSKRNDHRHHAMDALTIAFTTRSIVQYLNTLNARKDKTSLTYYIERKITYRDGNGHIVFNPPMPLNDFRAEAKRQLEAILVSIKAKNKVVTKNVNKAKLRGGKQHKVQLTPRGALHQETVYGMIRQYETEELKVSGKLTEEDILRVCNQRHREALLQRLYAFGGDAKKAFTGKNALDKNPIYLDDNQTATVPDKVKTVRLVPVMTINTEVTPALKVDKVIDAGIRRILQKRLEDYGGDANKAFSNLDRNPIWQNQDRGIAIKRVKIRAFLTPDMARPLHEKHNIAGHVMRDIAGNVIPNDYIKTGNNHHISFFIDDNGDLHEQVVTFFEATVSAIMGLPVIDKDYNKAQGWKFLFSMKQNEYFVFPNEKTGFNPSEIDLLDSRNASMISPNLFRVQKFSTRNYVFRHHLETNVEENKELRDTAWKRIQTPNYLIGIVKVRVNHIGQIVSVGEY